MTMTMTPTAMTTATAMTTDAPKPRSARRLARELALQGVYAWLLRGHTGSDETGSDANVARINVANSSAADIAAHLREAPDFGGADAGWFDTLLTGVLRDAPMLRTRFSPYIDRPLKELSPVEHAVLLIGSYELVHHVEVPWRVVINEAVELAKSFGGTDGFKFVNGVLDKLAAEVRATEVGAQAGRR